MNLADAIALFIDRTDFAGDDEAGIPGARRGEGIGGGEIGRKAIKAGFGGQKLVMEHLPPGGMGEIAGAEKGNALAACPELEYGGHAVGAGSAGVFGVDMEIGGVHCVYALLCCGMKRGKGTGPMNGRRFMILLFYRITAAPRDPCFALRRERRAPSRSCR